MAKAICDRCGFEYQLTELRKEWTNLMVCSGPGTNQCWEPRHPQEYVRAVRDDQGVRPNMRPEPADNFLLYNEVTYNDFPPEGFSWLTDDDGRFILDENGARILVEAT